MLPVTIPLVKLLSAVKRVLVRAGLYEHVEYSRPHLAYLGLTRPERDAARRRRLEAHRAFLSPGVLVFDVGANVGDMSECYLDLGCRVVAVEPDERCGRVLRRRFQRSGRFTLEPVAVSDTAGPVDLQVQAPGSAYNTLSTKWRAVLEGGTSSHAVGGMPFGATKRVEAVTLDMLVARHGLPGYLKLDVEGHEAPALQGLSRPVGRVMFEANLPEFHAEAVSCVERLRALDPTTRFQVVTNGAAPNERAWGEAAPLLEALASSKDRSVDVYAALPKTLG